ncbi:MAG: hypothetical protein Q4C53_02710 [Clostridia bacterium]|nr:hypothetical protein [Clostridia bacterium]
MSGGAERMHRYAFSFAAGPKRILLTTDEPLYADYFRWKTALLPEGTGEPIRLSVERSDEALAAAERYPGTVWRMQRTDDGAQELWLPPDGREQSGMALLRDPQTGDGRLLISGAAEQRILKLSVMPTGFLSILGRDVPFVHSACVADANGGVLIAGFPGKGKSTLVRECTEAGAYQVSDDMVCLRDGVAYAVESTIHLVPDPGIRVLPGKPFGADPGGDIKWHLDLSGDPGCFRAKAELRALVLTAPREGPGPCTVVRESFRKFLMVAAASTIRVMGNLAPNTGSLHKEADRLRHLPVYLVLRGTDPGENAARIAEILKGDTTHVSDQ